MAIVHNCKSAPCHVCGSQNGEGLPLPEMRVYEIKGSHAVAAIFAHSAEEAESIATKMGMWGAGVADSWSLNELAETTTPIIFAWHAE